LLEWQGFRGFGRLKINIERGIVFGGQSCIRILTLLVDEFWGQVSVYMGINVSGSKYDIHMWQHNMIVDYLKANNVLPPGNKTTW
jgi:hypothetical protein